MGEQSDETAQPVPYYSDEFVTLYHGDCREVPMTDLTAAYTATFGRPPRNQPRDEVRSAWVEHAHPMLYDHPAMLGDLREPDDGDD